MPKQEIMFDDKIDWQGWLAARRSAKFELLYPAQAAALDRYAKEFLKEPNIAFELPTGGGKTLIALLILDFWLAQGRKAAVLCGTKNLARQFKEEADALGITTILFEGTKKKFSTADKFKYAQGRAIAILNYWGYINQAPGIEPADVLVMDDAHLAENAAHNLFSIEINRFEHSTLFGILLASLSARFPHYTRLADYAAGSPVSLGIIELISFSDLCDAASEIISILEKSDECKDENGDLYWAWRRIKPSLLSSLCFIGPNNISIRPGCYPLANEKHLRQPLQRIMLSATIGLPDDLSRRIGIPNIKSVPLEARYRLAVPGKRLLLFPDSEAREKEMEALALDAASKLRRSVWLCSSGNEAALWSKKLQDFIQAKGITDQPIFIAKARAEEIDQFVDAKAGHLFTAARYDGMDFEGEQCRLVVMPSLPTACGLFERFISENLADAAFMNFRVLQRMKQALGRATRNDHDYAVYAFLKSSFSSYLTESESFDQFPENVQHEIEFGVDVSQKPFEDIVRIFAGFLRGSLGEIGFPQRAVEFPDEMAESKTELANTELDFWRKLFSTRSYDQAANDAETIATALAENDQPGYALFWRYLKAHAAYLRSNIDGDPAGLAHAKAEIVKVLDEPRQSSWFSRLSRLRQTLHMEVVPEPDASEEFDCITIAWNSLLDGELRNPAKHQPFFDSVRENIVGSDHGKFCHAMRQLMRLIGWQAEIREKGEGETDVLATVSVSAEQRALVVEAKPEMDADKPIPLRHVNQASGQFTRYQAEPRLKHHHIRALFVSKSNRLEGAAALAAGNLTFIPQSALAMVANLAIAAFQRYAAVRTRKGLLPKRSECLESLNIAPRLLGFYDAALHAGKTLTEEEVVRVLKR
jgi:Type III restriction enzyme, res subunit/Helicase C-terminal domain